MNDRITQFERLWATRPPLPRIMAFEPEPQFPMPHRSWLVRQTNEHERLSPGKKEQFWRAQTQAERVALLATELQRSTNEHERLRPDLRDRFWSADAEEKAELLATLSPIEPAFPGLPGPLPITAEEVEEIMRSLR